MCGHGVEWVEPSVHLKKDDLARFDVILLGIAPVLSVTSNKAYGVLSMIHALDGDPRLRFFIDAPEPARITANLRAVEKDFSTLVKPFYSLRRHYKDLSDESVKLAIAGGVNRLAASEWPLTVYPAMPWSNDVQVADKLPNGAASAVVGITVDPYYVSRQTRPIEKGKTRRWVVDASRGSKWTTNTLNSLSLPHEMMKMNRGATDVDVLERINGSTGSIIGPGIDGALWWSHRWAQSLNSLTPVASDWRVTSSIGSSWSHLAASIEEMSHIDNYELSVSQRKEYISALPSQDNVKEKLETTLGITK